jgi:UDP-N-acetylglucosamine--N-acetylmuramyl-(pentapeptide) pyrophosphoryl-undecaprenol N-acetylglucosamine transferase
MSAVPVVWIMAGGTGGHIMPGLAVAEILRAQGCQVLWLGNPERMEGRLVPAAGFEMIPVTFSGVRGKGLRDLIRAPFLLLVSIVKLLRAIGQQRPAVVLGMGGYVAFPGGVAAWLKRVPVVLHEQNAVAGKTNLWLAKVARAVLLGFPEAIKGGQWVGNPVRAAIAEMPAPELRYADRTGVLRVLVVGGSLGARALNETVPKALALIPSELRPRVTHQSGEQHLSDLQKAYQGAGVQAQCVAFIEDMAQAMGDADLLICRAGAMTVAEVAVAGVAALFIPFPFAVDDHQTANAKHLSDRQAAYLQQQRDLSSQWLAQWLMGQTREGLLQVAVKARTQAQPLAAGDIAQRCLSMAQGVA